MNSVELFAGGGGLALASSLSGFKHSFLVEWDKDSAKTLKQNISELHLRSDSSIFNGDIQSVDFSKYSEKIDLLSGGPPCQPFSIGGKAKAYNDRRDMFPEAARALAEIKPKAFIFEMFAVYCEKIFQNILAILFFNLHILKFVENLNSRGKSIFQFLKNIKLAVLFIRG